MSQRIYHKLSRVALALIATGLLALSTAYLALAAPAAQTAEQGQLIFSQKCVACHTIGGGVLVGPDLQGVTQRRDAAWLADFISAPDEMIAAGDPVATQLLAEYNNVVMPNLALTPTDVQALIAYLQDPQAVGLPGVVLPPGNAAQGQALFTGQAPLANGGLNCVACHNVAGVWPLGGGTLGLDLTHAYTKFGEAGLAGALAGLPFPTMQGVFLNRSLTTTEQADLLAFLQQADQSAPIPPQYTTWFWGAGVLGVVLLFGVLAFAWPRQKQSLSDRLRQYGR
jgi:mono/diheme cytochrome c family protein